MSAGDRPLIERRKRCPSCKQEYEGSEMICNKDGTILIAIVTENLVGKTIAGRYEIVSEIGRGGMSLVYRAHDSVMDRTVALKMLQSQLVSDQISTKRFHQEARAAACLTHPNVIAVYDFGIADTSKQPYIVMDYLVGESLSDVIKREGHVNDKRAIRIFMQACDALEHAHKKGVLHRDLKASNIMLVEVEGKKDIVKVVDFGIAKFMPSSGKQPQNLTQTGEIFGSPIYMSPEQCLGQTLDARSDIYSMGVLMYEALSGVPPLMGDTIIDTMQMHVSSAPRTFHQVRPDVKIAKELEAIVSKALEKAPASRFQSMQEFYDDLELLAYSLGINEKEGRPPSLGESLARITKPQNVVTPSADYQANRPAEKDYSVSRFGNKAGDRSENNRGTAAKLVAESSRANNAVAANEDDDEDLARFGGNRRVVLIVVGVFVFVIAGLALWFAVAAHH